jgi:DNA invertase Pin-like site-specific DNA recombinase
MIDSQIKGCREEAREHGWVIDESYVRTDEGRASITPMNERPGLGSLLTAVQSGARPFDCLIIDDDARLSRKVSEILNIYSTLSRHGVTIHVGSECPAFRYQRAVAALEHIELPGLYGNDFAELI